MKTSKSLKWWQWETLLVTMGGYALYYVIRKNLSIAMPLLGDIGVSKVQLGAFLTCGGIVYGVGRFLNGIVADRNSARKVMAIGLFICSAVNLLFGFSDFIVLGGNPGCGTRIADTIAATRRIKDEFGDRVFVWAGKWEDGITESVLGDPLAAAQGRDDLAIIAEFIDAGADCIDLFHSSIAAAKSCRQDH